MELDSNQRGADCVTIPGKVNQLQESFYLRQQFIFHRLSYRVQSARTKENETDEKAPGLVVSSLAPVANNVHATDHLTDGEETKDLGSGNANQGKLLRAGVAGTGQEVLGRGEVQALDGGRVAGDVDQGLEVGLEGGQGARRKGLDCGTRSRSSWPGSSLRRSHVLATENQLAKLKADPGVVEGRGNHS